MGVQESTYGLRRWTFSSMHGPALPLGCPRMALLPAALSVFKSRTEVSCSKSCCIAKRHQAASRQDTMTFVPDLTTHGACAGAVGVRQWLSLRPSFWGEPLSCRRDGARCCFANVARTLCSVSGALERACVWSLYMSRWALHFGMT